MSVTLNINGQDYFYPETGDIDWGPDATDWAIAVTQGMLQKAGGLFQLLDEVDFGPNYGLKSVYYKSRSNDVASQGTLRMARVDGIYWRNEADDADLGLTVDSSNTLLFNGSPIGGGSYTFNNTNSIDLTDSSSVITADLNLSSDTPDSGYINATNSIETDGLHTQVPIMVGDSGSGGTSGTVPAPGIGDSTKFLRGDGTWAASSSPLTFNDTNSIDLTDSAGTITADLKLSAASASMGNLKVSLSIETDGLLAQAPIANTSTTGFLSSTDWNTFNSKQAAGNYVTSLTGDVTGSGPGATATTIASGAVSLAKMANLAANSIIGNNTGAPATPLALSGTQVTAMLDNFVGDSGSGGTKGLVPAPTTGDATKFLKGDGTWDTAGGGGGGGGNSSLLVENLTLVCSVASNALTIEVKTSAGTDPSGSDVTKVAFGNPTLATGDYSIVSLTSALSLVVPQGATLGRSVTGESWPIYVWAINNSGAIELAVSTIGAWAQPVTTTTISSGATSRSTMYSGTGRSSVSATLIGILMVQLSNNSNYNVGPVAIVLAQGLDPGVVLSQRLGVVAMGGASAFEYAPSSLGNGSTVIGRDARSVHAQSTVIGNGANTGTSTSGSGQTAVGHGAAATGGSGSTAFGEGTTAGGQNSVALGAGASVSNIRGIAIGADAEITGNHSVAIGAGARAAHSESFVFAPGVNTTTTTATTGSGQAVFGDSRTSNIIQDLYLGRGAVANSLNSESNIRVTPASGTDRDGYRLNLYAGAGTGNANGGGGSVRIWTPEVGSSGTSQQSYNSPRFVVGMGPIQIGASSETFEHTLNTALGTPASGALTLLNGPSGTSGDPTGYIQITINGVTSYIPFWQ